MSDIETAADPLPAERTVAQMMSEIEDSLRSEPTMTALLVKLDQIAVSGTVAAESELRKGLPALNSGGIIAVISLLSDSLDAIIIRIAVGLYFFGLGFGALSWWMRALSSRYAMSANDVFFGLFKALRESPLAERVISKPEEFEVIANQLKNGITKLSSKMKQPGERAARWTILSASCFFIATGMLVADFEILPLSKNVRIEKKTEPHEIERLLPKSVRPKAQ